MARSLDDFPDYLRARGFRVVGVPGWRQRKRPFGLFRPKGHVAHHTGGAGNGMAYAAGILTGGYRELPGPLCQIALNRHGTVIMIAAGRANHAGKTRRIGFMSAGDGNSQAVGTEAMNTGTEGWSNPHPKNPFGTQYNAFIALSAALEDYMGWKRGSTLAHGETSTSGKWDPGIRDSSGRTRMLNMDVFRREVRKVVFGKPTPGPTPAPSPLPDPVPEKPVVPTGPDKSTRWHKDGLVNHGAPSTLLRQAKHAAAWRRRRKNLVLEVKSFNADAFLGLECGSVLSWHYLTTKYKKFGYALVPKGAGGRHWWIDPKTQKLVESGCIHPPRHDGDLKEAPWFVAQSNGSLAYRVGFHLDPQASEAFKAKQMESIVLESFEIAARHGIGKSRIFFIGDMASTTAVPKLLAKYGYRDALAVADKAVFAELKSFNEGDPELVGDSVDIVGVYVGDEGPGVGDEHERPVPVASQRPTTNTDHNHRLAVIDRQVDDGAQAA